MSAFEQQLEQPIQTPRVSEYGEAFLARLAEFEANQRLQQALLIAVTEGYLEIYFATENLEQL